MSAPGPPLGQRRVAVVHVGGDVVEQERARERAGSERLDPVDGDLAARDAAEDLAQRRQVEDVREDLAVRLDEDREAAVARGDGEQVRGPLALLPERRPRPGPAARQEQGPGGVLAEPRREQRAARDLADDELLELVGLREQQRLDRLERHLDVGQPDRDPVVGPDRLDLGPELLADPRLERERPRGVDAAAERRQQHEPPVAELVAEALDDDPPVGRQGADDLALVLEVGDEVLGRELVEVVVRLEPVEAPPAGPAGPGRGRPRPRGRTPRAPGRARSAGRPRRRARTAACPARPGAGDTVTRSWPISSIRQLLAPSVITSPARLS